MFNWILKKPVLWNKFVFCHCDTTLKISENINNDLVIFTYGFSDTFWLNVGLG